MGKLIGVFSTDITSRVQGKIYRALHESLKNKGYTLVFFSYKLNQQNFCETEDCVSQLIRIAEKMDLSAMVLHVESLHNRELIDALIAMGKSKDIPVFAYDCDNYGYTAADGVIAVNLNYIKGFEDGVRHLVEHHGCKNIYMLAGTMGNKYSEERIQAYRNVMMANNLVCSDDRIAYGGFWEIPAIKAMDELMERIERDKLPFPEAICCANDSMAIAAAKELRKRGYRVPQDIMITGFDGIEDGKFNVPAISTCEPVYEEVPNFIQKAIEDGIRSGSFIIPLRFTQKESCGCVNCFKASDELEMSSIMENSRRNAWQHSMLSNLQLHLLDNQDIDNLFSKMLGTVYNFKGMSLLYCIRADLETQSNFDSDFDELRVRMDFGFYKEYHYETFKVSDIIPDFENEIVNSSGRDFFIFQTINTAKDRFGYSIIKADNFVTNEIRIFSQFSASFINMLEGTLRNIRLEQANQRLNEMYIHDMLTGLYNRVGYYRELEEYLKRDNNKDGYINIVSVDMDDLKYINDNFGHQEGDNAIRTVADAIRSCVPQPCICARFGGDEFMISFFTEDDRSLNCSELSAKLNGYLKKHPLTLDRPYSVGVSAGCTCTRVSEISEVKFLEKTADENMYIDKRERKQKKN